MNRVVLATLLAGALLLDPTAQAGAKTPVRLAPATPCTRANHMDFFVDEDNIMWECECVIYIQIADCRWQVIGGVEAVSSRRIVKKHPRAIIRYALPQVTA